VSRSRPPPSKRMVLMKLINSDCIAAMKDMPDNSVDSIVTDPPYELGFMGKSWDASGIAFNIEVWQQALRVLKPGGHLIAFSGSRTYHRMAVAIEDAGFQIRDQIMWVYGSGFPKSLNIGKHLDEWEGWGTALKPAHEPMVLARKPIEGTVANNVMTWGVGGLNIDGSRVAHLSEADRASATPQGKVTSNKMAGAAPDIDDAGRVEVERPDTSLGRWPANFIHDGSDEVVALFPAVKGATSRTPAGDASIDNAMFGGGFAGPVYDDGLNTSAARFFYCAKTSKRDRNEGLDEFEEVRDHDGRADGGVGGDNPRNRTNNSKLNHHPTVKPTSLMQYLVRLVTPPNGIVLDPFMGSGSTGKACAYEGFDFIGIDMTPEYVEIARARIEFAVNNRSEMLDVDI